MRARWSVGAPVGIDPKDLVIHFDPEPELIETPLGPASKLPRRSSDLTLHSTSFADRAVAAVVLGASGIAAGLGAPLVAHASQIEQPPPETIPPSVIVGARELDLSREAMTPEELAEARRGLWSVFAAVTPPATITTLPISHGVGVGQQNKHDDVLAIQTRLAELGFDVKVDGKFGAGTLRMIRLYEAIVTGKESIADTTGFVSPGGMLHRAIASPDSVRWVQMPASGPGFINADADGFSWGTSRMAAVVVAAGQRYQTNYLASHPGATFISLNDASRKNGGHTSHHETHEAGLDLDVRLPRTDGLAGTRVGHANYDREATYAMIAAFAQDPKVERILFSDNVLLARIANSNVPWKAKIVHGGSVHKDHFHVDISPPPPPAASAAIRSG